MSSFQQLLIKHEQNSNSLSMGKRSQEFLITLLTESITVTDILVQFGGRQLGYSELILRNNANGYR